MTLSNEWIVEWNKLNPKYPIGISEMSAEHLLMVNNVKYSLPIEVFNDPKEFLDYIKAVIAYAKGEGVAPHLLHSL